MRLISIKLPVAKCNLALASCFSLSENFDIITTLVKLGKNSVVIQKHELLLLLCQKQTGYGNNVGKSFGLPIQQMTPTFLLPSHSFADTNIVISLGG